MDRASYQKPTTPTSHQQRAPATGGGSGPGAARQNPNSRRTAVRRSLSTTAQDQQSHHHHQSTQNHPIPSSPNRPASSSSTSSNPGPGPPRLRCRSADRTNTSRHKNQEETTPSSSGNLLIDANLTPEEHNQLIELFQSTDPSDLPSDPQAGIAYLIQQIRGNGIGSFNPPDGSTLFGIGATAGCSNPQHPTAPVFDESFMLLQPNSSSSFNIGPPQAQSSFNYPKQPDITQINFEFGPFDLIQQIRKKVNEFRQLQIRKHELEYYKERNKLLDPELLTNTISKLQEFGILIETFNASPILTQLIKAAENTQGSVLIPCPIDQREALMEVLRIMFKLNETVENTLNSVGPTVKTPQSNARIVEMLKKRLDEEFSQLLKGTDAVEKYFGEFMSLENFYDEILSYYHLAESREAKLKGN